MKKALTSAIDRTRTLQDDAENLMREVLGSMKYIPSAVKLELQLIKSVNEQGGRELINRAYRSGKQASYDIISMIPPKTERQMVREELTEVEIEGIQKQVASWMLHVRQTSVSLIGAVNAWMADQRSMGRADKFIKVTIENDLKSRNDAGNPNGRITGQYLKKYISDFSAFILDIERFGQERGFLGNGS